MFERIVEATSLEPWGENAEFFQELGKLAGAGFGSPEESHAVLEALQRLRVLLDELLFICAEGSGQDDDFSSEDADALARIYGKALRKIRDRHGLNSLECSSALTRCLGVFALGYIICSDLWHIPLPVDFSDFAGVLIS